MQISTQPFIVEQTYMLSANVKHFVCHALQTACFDYLPGQFITIHFEHDTKLLKRSYSIANAPVGNNCIEFAAGYVDNGIGSEFLFNLKVGNTINVTGPFGRLILKDELPKRYILAATSTGVTPYRAMLKELDERLLTNPALQILIMLGVRTPADVLYKEEFEEFANAHSKQVRFRMQLSRAQGSSLSPNQFHGYIQHAFPEINLNPQEDIIYLCGNPRMIDECFENLKTRNFAVQQIVREKYISR